MHGFRPAHPTLGPHSPAVRPSSPEHSTHGQVSAPVHPASAASLGTAPFPVLTTVAPRPSSHSSSHPLAAWGLFLRHLSSSPHCGCREPESAREQGCPWHMNLLPTKPGRQLSLARSLGSCSGAGLSLPPGPLLRPSLPVFSPPDPRGWPTWECALPAG